MPVRLKPPKQPCFARRTCVLIVAAAGLLMQAGLSHGANAPMTEEEMATLSARQLIIVFDPTPGNPTEQEVLAAVSKPETNPALYDQIGRPAQAGRMLPFDPPSAMRDQLTKYPRSPRAVLERSLVVTYASSEQADMAFARLREDPRVSSASRNANYQSSVVPGDQYFSYSSGLAPGLYQWGMEALNFPSAWNLARGTAYLADLNTGIDCAGGTTNPCVTHVDLQQNFREQFSENFFPGDTTIAEHLFGAFAGHGTHVAGIMSATPHYGSFSNGSGNSGVAGACWTCSLAVIKRANAATTATAITFAVDHGLQVLNMSFGDSELPAQFANCTDGTNNATCTAIDYAVDRDVLMVAASGNSYRNRIQFPAMHFKTIAVGGLEYGDVFFRTGYGLPSPAAPCTGPGVQAPECGSNWGVQNDGVTPQVAAPAKDIVSTFPAGRTYNASVHCGDQYGPNAGSSLATGYGDCTGTSMSSPHVAGLVGLMRSVNPLLAMDTLKATLLAASDACTGTDATLCGQGIPDAEKAVRAVMGPWPAAVNRVTPLFSFYSDTLDDHLYTITAQMSLSAFYGGLLPRPVGATAIFVPVGSTVPSYPNFPIPVGAFGPFPTPRAQFSVFTTHVDPTDTTAELKPLYRMSWVCAGTCSHSSHAYTYDSSGIAAFESVGYQVDGIEGYFYPKTKAFQPANTVKLCRKYNLARDDYILFAGTGANGATCGNGDGVSLDPMTGLPWTDYSSTIPIAGGTDWIGWVPTLSEPATICSGGMECGKLAALVVMLNDD